MEEYPSRGAESLSAIQGILLLLGNLQFILPYYPKLAEFRFFGRGHAIVFKYMDINLYAQSNTTHDVTIFIIGNRFRSY